MCQQMLSIAHIIVWCFRNAEPVVDRTRARDTSERCASASGTHLVHRFARARFCCCALPIERVYVWVVVSFRLFLLIDV